MSNLVERLLNEHPNYSDAIAAADKIQELQIDLNILKKAYHVLVKERDVLQADIFSIEQAPQPELTDEIVSIPGMPVGMGNEPEDVDDYRAVLAAQKGKA